MQKLEEVGGWAGAGWDHVCLLEGLPSAFTPLRATTATLVLRCDACRPGRSAADLPFHGCPLAAER